MRIIGGKCKGRRLNAPKSIKARPTTDFAKESLFNILSNRTTIEGKHILDLFAGIGSISFEFASRNAKSVLSIDQQINSIKFINIQAKQLGLKINAKKFDVFKFISLKNNNSYDIVFADPPYNNSKINSLPDLILNSSLLNENGLLIIEHGSENEFTQHPNLIDKRTYSRVNFSFFKHI
ncbi:MAG: 16S rRNA (guanine(966)-N(2))-methyltransferase RsmD [Crocinitomicaceae bacterium]|nr:16S rRNA (guanine(966)-N(2))-methyltransferase RsmD [Crocinitomicaceae bacterium]